MILVLLDKRVCLPPCLPQAAMTSGRSTPTIPNRRGAGSATKKPSGSIGNFTLMSQPG
jgi:hypothetical protein